ncbi:hypothetical protein IC232_21010 [Microvirga sp. BT688]|uniref:hypothetical protein n=1 Tax=Microvirga sp. TaxID=1873136 RepID=UPI00168940AF|nr:hypothetical protein [Microvirga sp.]MBD2749165.1 hypothetical protein [Microvirga sp.]
MNYEYTDQSYLDSYEDESWPSEEPEDLEDESLYSEARRRRRRTPPPVKPATGASAFRPRPSGPSGPVTQAQLEAALARVRQQVTANATAIKTIDGRVRTVIADNNRLQATAKRDTDKLRADLKTTQTLSALIPLIAPAGTTFGQVAPLLHLVGPDLMGGSGATTPASGGLLGSSNNLIAIGALLFASGVFDNKK